MADIKLEDLTSGYIDGLGVFDVLMTAISSRLDEQFALDRLKGSDYATAYLGAMQYAMSQGLQFILGKQQADKQADLLQQQIDASKAQTERENLLATANIAQINANISLINAQILKTNAETTLLQSKKYTEDAQFLDTVNSNTVTGLIGKQKALYQKQADGFDRDAEQKALKLLGDLWTITMTASPDLTIKPKWMDTTNSADTGQLETAYEKAINNAFASSGIVPFP
jgi:hypothetical protein